MRALHALTAALGTIALASCRAAPDGIPLSIVDEFDDHVQAVDIYAFNKV